MNNIESFNDIQPTLEFLMLSDYEFQRDLDDREVGISNNMRSEEYLEQFYNHFFLFKRVFDDPILDSIKTSTEAIANMSKANQKTRNELSGYTHTLFKWVNQVLTPAVKNAQRIAVAMSRSVRSQEVRTKLENGFKNNDLRTEEYQTYFRNLCAVVVSCGQAIEKIQNVNNNKDVVEVQSVANDISEQTTNAMTSINDFNTRKAGEENQVSPADGHWLSDSYLSQLANTFNQVISTCQNLGRNRSTIIQILNAMETTSDTQTRKINKVKLDAIKTIVHDQIKPNLGSMCTTASNIGKKLQQMYKLTMASSTNVKAQAPTKNETTTV